MQLQIVAFDFVHKLHFTSVYLLRFLNSTLVICLTFAFIGKLNKLITHKVCRYKSDQACLCEPVSLQVAIATSGDALTSRDR